MTTDKNVGVTFEDPDRLKVRFHHAEALHRLNRRPEAVRYLREPDDLAKGKAAFEKIIADWLQWAP